VMLRASDALYLRCERCDALLTVATLARSIRRRLTP
jgi:hypothetical protein